MNWLYKLERKFGKLAIPNLMAYICSTALAVYIMWSFIGVNLVQWITLDRGAVFAGQVWRLLTFVFVPPSGSLFMVLISLYFYYIIGTELENAWGSFKFNAYYVCGMVGIIIAAMLTGYGMVTYLNLTLFLAYAAIYPENQILLFFVIPIKGKYFAYLDILLLAVNFIIGTAPQRVSIVFSLLNCLLFFGPGIYKKMKDNKKYAAQRRQFRKTMEENKNREGRHWN